ncbi:hypothetical protein J7E79_12090 [Bacillus sp. ISL-40]|uniref:hypothetical protein n=1 Tax=unclassified Bacillus (in: firmicutes) TaxID=185979 RepID=UPI001BE831C6|nr:MULTISPECIES: hypothetical protein [unclassified Bacillus (in: firmicutes)]MBT2698154.1 hypothetical protein [Bacillus sp. ISL-40]MBT2742024.1 hypothetical protein [Bacillus sp. ISL-77]
MKKLYLLIFTLAFIFSFDVRALADEGHSHSPNIKQATETLKNSGTKDQDASSEGDDMEGMDHDSGTDMEGMNHDSGTDMEGSGGEAHDHHAAMVELPPNYKVLGTFGAVNLSFILIGVWNKWFRRKGDLNNGNA